MFVYPGTKSTFNGSAQTALAAGYVEISDADYERLASGHLAWKNGGLVSSTPVEPKKFKPSYEYTVSMLIRQQYSQDAVEAILANYLLDPTNTKYRYEFENFSKFRESCKQQAKELVSED